MSSSSSTHVHYQRFRRPVGWNGPVERVLPDSRQKWWMRYDSGDLFGTVSILLDPRLWERWQTHPFLVTTLFDIVRLHVPSIYLQEGPTCGLYAMKMIAPHLSIDSLLHDARRMGFTARGEMFCALEMEQLARRHGLNASAIPIEQVVERAVNETGVAMIPYDSDVSGISYRGGKNAHWGVVWQMCQLEDQEGSEWVAVMSHSSMVLPALETWSELVESNRQLKQATLDLETGWEDELDARCLRGWAVWISR